MGYTEDYQRLRRERDAARSDAQNLRVRLLQVEIELAALKQIIAEAVALQEQAKHAPAPAPARPAPPAAPVRPAPPPAPPLPTREQFPIGPRLLRLREVRLMVGLSKTTLSSRIANQQFPAPVRLGAHSVAWREADIREWQEALATGPHRPGR